MRLWSLHPQYLDPQALVALWREALLARAVLSGETRGYRNHPQLERFRNHAAPLAAVAAYLEAVYAEAERRGYAFDQRKIAGTAERTTLVVTSGQLGYEWAHLMNKLQARNPTWFQRWQGTAMPEPHPLFEVCPGDVASWERR